MNFSVTSIIASIINHESIIKDITSIIGATTGTIALFNTWRINRINRLEPHFKNKWSVFQKKLESYLKAVNSWIIILKNELNQSTHPKKLSESGYLDLPSLDYSDTYNWKYDLKFKNKIESFDKTVRSLIKEIKEYNNLKSLSSIDSILYDFLTEDKDKDEEYKKWQENLRQQRRKYTKKSNPTIDDVSNSRSYKCEVNNKLSAIHQKLRVIDNKMSRIKNLANFYNTKFQ